MINKITTACLFICFYMPATVYHVSAPVALHAIHQTNKHIWVFINIDIYDTPSLYTRNYKDIFKHLHKTSTEQYRHVKSILNKIMQYINPLYTTAYGSANHIIGVTRRDLSWSHLVRATCYDQNVTLAPERYQFVIPNNATPEDPDTNRYIELNTNILYIDDNECACCIAQYLSDTQADCHGIIYIDSDTQATHTCVAQLQQRMPQVQTIGLCVQNDALQQKNAELQDFNNYLEQLYAQCAQDTIEKKLNAINEQVSKHITKANLMEQTCHDQ